VKRHAGVLGLTASVLLAAVPAEASAFGFHWPAPEPRLEPSTSSEHASRRAVQVTATPRVGGRQTTFRVRLRSAARLGPYAGRHRTYAVVMRSPQSLACIGRMDRWAYRARRGTALTIRVSPHAKGARWCHGRYRGSVHYVDTRLCRRVGRCEMPEGFRRLRRLVGRFAVTVR
jgi:hypothetical protein